MDICNERHGEVNRRLDSAEGEIKEIRNVVFAVRESNALLQQLINKLEDNIDKQSKQPISLPKPFWESKDGQRVILIVTVTIALIVLMAVGINASEALGIIKGV